MLNPANLVWFQNPGTPFSPNSPHWKEFTITSSELVCDTGFDLIEYKNKKYVVCGGFSSGVLAVFNSESENWTETSSVSIETVPYPKNGSFYFTQIWHDMNGDSIPDAIITIGSYGVNNGKLIIYPGVDKNGIRSLSSPGITVYDKFPVYSSSLGSPGEAVPFYYKTNDQANGFLPSILVSGDDDGNMYMFDPTGYTDPKGSDFNFEYSMEIIFKTEEINDDFITPFNAPTVGQMSVADFNGDGCNDIVVPSYALKQLIFLELKNTKNCDHGQVQENNHTTNLKYSSFFIIFVVSFLPSLF